jgi:Ni2+-binding GTPase involved in maturation of urease and hydrogenase
VSRLTFVFGPKEFTRSPPSGTYAVEPISEVQLPPLHSKKYINNIDFGMHETTGNQTYCLASIQVKDCNSHILAQIKGTNKVSKHHIVSLEANQILISAKVDTFLAFTNPYHR